MRQAELPQVGGRSPGRPLLIAIALLGLMAGITLDGWSQGASIPGSTPKGKADKKKGDPKAGMPKPPPPPPKPLDVAIDPVTQLPKDYKVPPDKPDVMTTHESLLTTAEIADLKKIESKYKSLLRGGTGQLKDDEKAIIRKGIQYRLALLCEKDNLPVLHTKREDLTIRDLQQAGKLSAAADVRNFRKFIMAEIVKQSEALLKKNLYVRIQAVTLVGELDLTDTDPQRNLKLEAFADGLPLLSKVIADPEQPTPVKIAATRSIVRLLRYGAATVPQKHEVANAIVAELQDEKKYFWYQVRLVEALSLLDTVLDLQNRKPFIVDTLRKVMNDPNRDWQVRAMAARSLGRVPFDPAVPVPAVMAEIAQFAHDMAKQAQQNPKNSQWKTNFWWLYLAFNAHDGTDQEATRRGRGGLRNNQATASASEPVYQLIHPITNKLLNDQPVTVDLVKALADWLDKNKPPGTGVAKQ